MSESASPASASVADADLVVVTVDGQRFGLPITRVRDVFVPERITRVPLAPPSVAGILNLRGRIVTTIDLRVCLDAAPRPKGAPMLALGIDVKGESYGLLVDSVGEVVHLEADRLDDNPAHLDARLKRVACGIVRLDDGLLVILDVDSVLDLNIGSIAA